MSIGYLDRFIRESAILSYESVDSQPIIINRLLIKCRSSADRVSIGMSIEYRDVDEGIDRKFRSTLDYGCL